MRVLKRLKKDLSTVFAGVDRRLIGKCSKDEYVATVRAEIDELGLDPEDYWNEMIATAAESHLENRSKKSPIAIQPGLAFDESELNYDVAKEAIIRLGNGNFVSWAHATLDDIAVHLDQQIKEGQAILNRAAGTSSLLQSQACQLMKRNHGMTLEEAMQARGHWGSV